jgi:hypothetical protein
VSDIDAVMAPLDDWLQRQESDPQLFWRTGLGDLQNLFDEAIDRMRTAEAALRVIEGERR